MIQVPKEGKRKSMGLEQENLIQDDADSQPDKNALSNHIKANKQKQEFEEIVKNLMLQIKTMK